MNTSIVITVYNEEKYIESCLSSIYLNSEQPYELIVVDGGSTDNTVNIIRDKFPSVILMNDNGHGAASGRNVGINIAKGDIIAFTDGDCIVSNKWIESISQCFRTNDVDAVGGKIINAKPSNYIEKYWGNLAWNLIMTFGDEPYTVTKRTLNDAFVTANCAYKKSLLHKLGGFNEWFYNNAEDIDLSWRALNVGAKMRYVPDAVIYAHNVTTIIGVIKKSFRNGLSSSKLQKVYGSKINVDTNIYRMLLNNIIGLFLLKENTGLNIIELISHLFGKYYGSIKIHIINI